MYICNTKQDESVQLLHSKHIKMYKTEFDNDDIVYLNTNVAFTQFIDTAKHNTKFNPLVDQGHHLI